MKSSATTAGATAQASQYNDLRKDAEASSWLLPHEQTVPNMTLKVEAGKYFINGNKYIFAGGNSPTFTAPVSNSRIDLLTIDTAGTLAITQGVAGASPAVPTYPANKIIIAEVYVRTGSTTIRDTDPGGAVSYISYDVRPFMTLSSGGGGFDNVSITYDSDDRVATVVDSDLAITYTFTYTADDLINTITNGTNTWTFTYSADDQITGIVKT